MFAKEAYDDKAIFPDIMLEYGKNLSLDMI